jgi:hypothetical protein
VSQLVELLTLRLAHPLMESPPRRLRKMELLAGFAQPQAEAGQMILL